MASSGKRLKPTDNSQLSPFRYDFGPVVGNGKDNTVRAFLGDTASRWVVKISKQKGEKEPTADIAFASTLYKKKKYEILKTFLGDFVPDSFFVVGHKTDGIRNPRPVPRSYTVQRQVPDVKLNELTPEQQRDPRLLRQMYVLLLKLRNMHEAIDEVNRIMGADDNPLDGKLDLGGISKYAQQKSPTEGFDAAEVVREFGASPNLLVDPEEMRLYCIDFDDGTWTPEKEAAKGVLEHVAATPQSRAIIRLPHDMPQA